MADLIGKKLGKYEVLQQLGQGGMATVYKAFQPGIERFVAIKVMHGHLSSTDDFVTRFRREAQAVGQLQHPHIVRVIDFDIEDDSNYMVMEYIQGQTLRTYIDEHTPIDSEKALHIAAQLADALDYAHKRGMIHRDIKPGNVMFMQEQDDHAILTDFGVARLLDRAGLTMSGATVGTPNYMSPEAVKGEPVDERADIYSLGVVLYEMVTGRKPFEGDTPFTVMMKQVNEPITLPRDILPDLPNVIESVLLKALAKEPSERYQNAGDLRDALRQAIAVLRGEQTTQVNVVEPTEPAVVPTPPVAEETAETVVPPTSPPPAQPQRNWLPYGLAGGAILILIILFALLNSDDNNTAVVAITQTATNAAITAEAGIVTEAPTAEATAIGEVIATETAVVLPDTPVPSPTATSTPIATPTPEPIPVPSGQLRFNGETAVTLQMNRMPQPPVDTHYELWLANGAEIANIGILSVVNGEVVATLPVAAALVGNFDQLLISIEPDDDPDEAMSNSIVFNGQLDEATFIALRRLVIDEDDEPAVLSKAEQQLAIAVQHSNFALNELSSGNLDEGKRHAEHIVNILDGETGAFFGDLDGDGLAQNPGDGVGVRVYLQDAQEAAQSIVDGATVNNEAVANQLLTEVEHSVTTQQMATEEIVKVIASDTAEEAESFAINVVQLLDTLLQGNDLDENGVIEPIAGEGGLLAAKDTAFAAASFEIFAANPRLVTTLDETDFPQGRLQFADNDTSRVSDFTLQLSRIPQPPADTQYELWLANDALMVNVGVLSVDEENNASLNGRIPENLLAIYHRALISQEPAVIHNDETISDIVLFTGELSADLLTPIRQIVVSDEALGNASLLGAEEQVAVALSHAGFSLNELNAHSDLPAAKRHAEHVVNILVGTELALFGDLNNDGLAENPGDDVGVQIYLSRTHESLQQALAFDLSLNQQLAAEQAVGATENSILFTNEAINQAIKILSSDTVEEATPFAQETVRLIGTILEGSDSDNNGVIDPFAGEGAILAAYQFTLDLATIPLFANE